MSGRLSLKAAFRRQVLELFHDNKLITRTQKDVLMQLATFLGPRGLYPSHEAIAKSSKCTVRSVIRALERAYTLGIVERIYRRKRQDGKVVRDSNRYRLIVNTFDRARISGKHLSRAVFQRVQHLSDRMTQKASRNILETSEGQLFGRRYPEPHGPSERSLDDWIELIRSWDTA